MSPMFPLGSVLVPGMILPLHVFEPRYRAMVRDALASDRLIGMIQPRIEPADPLDPDEVPELFDVGCLGRIAGCDEVEDGRFNIVLEGLSRFRVAREATVDTPYRQVDADRTEVRQKYVDKFAKILPERTLARFYQIENKMDDVIRYDLAATIPVVDPAAPAAAPQ